MTRSAITPGEPGSNPSVEYNSPPRPRPRFDLESPAPPEQLLAHFRARLQEAKLVSGLVVEQNSTIEMTLVDDHVRVWSPQLSLLVSPSTQGGGSVIKARFGPHPHVWGMFIAGYAISGMLSCALLLFGLVQIFLDQTPWALYATPLAILGAAFVYGAAYVGQGLGHGQMHELRMFLDATLRELRDN
ncbi:MAG: hypothetical protein ACJAZ8_001264 [Planctomycetota bacterium]|jgi:hypothetical protein